jgi:hypothetical protein
LVTIELSKEQVFFIGFMLLGEVMKAEECKESAPTSSAILEKLPFDKDETRKGVEHFLAIAKEEQSDYTFEGYIDACIDAAYDVLVDEAIEG